MNHMKGTIIIITSILQMRNRYVHSFKVHIANKIHNKNLNPAFVSLATVHEAKSKSLNSILSLVRWTGRQNSDFPQISMF